MTGTALRAAVPLPGGARFLSGAALLLLAGCSGAPAVNVVGSYFPAWMLCAVIGIAAALCFRQILVVFGIENGVVLPLFTHAGIALAFTLAAWLLWFGH